MTSPTCNGVCASSLRSDDRYGVIHGPWLVDMDGTIVHAPSRTAYAAMTGVCCYCGADIPERRYRTILRESIARGEVRVA